MSNENKEKLKLFLQVTGLVLLAILSGWLAILVLLVIAYRMVSKSQAVNKEEGKTSFVLKKVGLVLAGICTLPFVFQALTGIAFGLVMLISGGEDRVFYKQYMEVGVDVGKILVREGICEHAQKKCGGHVYAFDPLTGGFYLELRGVQSQKIVKEIADSILQKFYETPNMQHVVFEAYKKPDSKRALLKIMMIFFLNLM